MTPSISWVSLALLATSESAAIHARRTTDARAADRERARAERKRQRKHKR